LFGKEAPEASPVTILGVRIPADGTPAHLLHLTTTNDCGGGLDFLHRVPDTRRYWPGKESWAYRDLNRLDCQLNETVARMRHLQQKDHSDQEAAMRQNSSTNEKLEVSQRQQQLFSNSNTISCRSAIPHASVPIMFTTLLMSIIYRSTPSSQTGSEQSAIKLRDSTGVMCLSSRWVHKSMVRMAGLLIKTSRLISWNW
jgi:hypothetical protein